MTKPLDLTANQVTAICKGAEKAGYVPVIQIGKTILRLVPEDHVNHTDDEKRLPKDEDFRL